MKSTPSQPTGVFSTADAALAAAGVSPESPVLAGISGGMDSMVLLDLLLRRGQNVVVVHVNHGLRGAESDADAALVAAVASPWPIEIVPGRVAERAKLEKLSLETAGRMVRRECFARIAKERGIQHIILAHHADDQAETLLWNLARGCGLSGIAGMAGAEVQEFPSGIFLTVIRPLLGLRRSDLQAHAVAVGLQWREDQSNRDESFTRNRIRHQVIPALESASGRDPVLALARLASIAHEDDALLDKLARESLESLRREENSLDLPGFRALPLALQRRVLLLWLGPADQPGFDDIAGILAIAGSTHRPARTNLPGNRHVARREKRLWLEGNAPPAPAQV